MLLGRAAGRSRAAVAIGCLLTAILAHLPAAEEEEPWWRNSSFSHRHVLTVETSNFKERVASTHKLPMLIAFYDPKSASFRELRPQLEKVADALASFEDSGTSMGALAACDVTVHTFLADQEAPELDTAWQDPNPGSFRFGKQRFFPLIIKAYVEGMLWGEYTGVVNAVEIMKFLVRLRALRGGEALGNAAAVRTFLRRPGPFALGCGLLEKSTQRSIFNQTAHKLHGLLTFGIADAAVCIDVFDALESPWPKVVWARDGDLGPAAVKSTTELNNATDLGRWLDSQRGHALEEMTPDTSHLYLEKEEPLVIFLVDPSDNKTRQLGEACMEDIEAEEVDTDFQFVWADCQAFGSQFQVTNECPVVVTVDTADMAWTKIALKDLQYPPRDAVNRGLPWAGSTRTLSSRLLAWLQGITGERQPAPKAATSSAGSRAACGSGTEETCPVVPSSPVPGEDAGGGKDVAGQGNDELEEGTMPSLANPDWFLEAVPDLNATHSETVFDLFNAYHSLLVSMMALRNSFEATYGSYLKFDFTDLIRAQRLEPSMRHLAQRPESVKHAVGDRKVMKKLWAAIEARAAVVYELQKNTTRYMQNRTYVTRLVAGYDLLRGLFRRMYKELLARDMQGTLQLPEFSKREVDRRSAADLSVREFFEQYAKRGQPVIITGLNVSEEEPWSLEFFKERCNVTAEYRMKNASRQTWGRLQSGGMLPLPEFIDSFRTDPKMRQWYLHDWSLPRHCPAVFGPAPFRGFTVPKYFAGDYFQRADFEGYKHAWPSLFIGSEETESAMHIDSGGTNFWLYLLSGRKEWRFYSRRDLINLYPRPSTSHFYFDIFRSSTSEFPLTKYAQLYEGVQEAAELIFIPGGNPHGVKNLEHIHGISMNYVDASNVWVYLWETLAERKWREFEIFTDNTTVPHGVRSEQEPMRFGDWKSTRWKDLAYDIL